MAKTYRTPYGRPIDLDYFVEWRPYLWRRPLEHALKFMGDLRGKRILEIGGRSGHMTSLFAMQGAQVTMVDVCDLAAAQAEVAKWGVTDQVRLIQTAGGFDEIAGETFNVIFTKSVLWGIEPLGEFLDRIDEHLAEGGRVAFLENWRGGRVLFWVRRNLIHRSRFDWESHYVGIHPDQIPLFEERFADLHVRRHRFLVYEIFGRKRRAG